MSEYEKIRALSARVVALETLLANTMAELARLQPNPRAYLAGWEDRFKGSTNRNPRHQEYIDLGFQEARTELLRCSDKPWSEL